MELPQACQFGTEGRKPTHDFLSLCSHSSVVHQDPTITIPPSQGNRLKTLDLLHVGKASSKEENNMKIPSSVETRTQPPAPAGEEHVLPGGIGTYTISRMTSYVNNNVHQRPVLIKPEGSMFAAHHQQQQHQASSTTDQKNDEHSNCSSYTGSGFTLWEESAANNKKGKTGKENSGEKYSNINSRELPGGTNPRQWGTTGERPTQFSAADNHRHSFNSPSHASGQRSQSFMDMLTSAKNSCQEEESDDNEELVIKKENSAPLNGDLRVTPDGKSSDQKANTPRSKHSATEQRRRSKINDRQALRGLIPHSDQKRDKASFLLEVIEYIQFLQEKVHKYEVPYQGLNNEPVKSMPWKNNHGPAAEPFIDHSRARNISSGPGSMFPNGVGLNIPGNAQKAESDFSSATPSKAAHDHPGITNNKIPFPMPSNFFNSVQNSCFPAQNPPQLQCNAQNMALQAQPQLYNSRSCTSDRAVSSDKAKERDLTVESGRINISSIYSQGLLNTLTQALQASGVDLSQANISVQIELGKRGIGKPAVLTSNFPAQGSNQGITRTRMGTDEDCDHQVMKKLKTGKS
ncbi:hypothetical protein ACFE04_009324 [Oxalis oulophora]